MDVQQLAEGLWRWTAPHPEWTESSGGPAGWERTVSCFYFESVARPDAPIVLFDPLLPAEETPDHARFWTALERDLERTRRPLAILIGNQHHGRSSAAVRHRRGGDVPIYVPAGSESHLAIDPVTPTQAGSPLPAGVTAHRIDALSGPELAFWIDEHRALVLADAVLGTEDGGVRLAPPDWADEKNRALPDGRRRFLASVRALLDLDPARLLLCHGESVLSGGGDALRLALEAAIRPAPREPGTG